MKPLATSIACALFLFTTGATAQVPRVLASGSYIWRLPIYRRAFWPPKLAVTICGTTGIW